MKQFFYSIERVIWSIQKEDKPVKTVLPTRLGEGLQIFIRLEAQYPFLVVCRALIRGSNCPLCGGDGFKNIETTESVELRIYYRRRDFIDVGFNADIPNNVIQTVGYMDDYEKLTKAKELLIDIGKHNQGRYKRISEPYNQGFKQNPTQYVVIFWERV